MKIKIALAAMLAAVGLLAGVAVALADTPTPTTHGNLLTPVPGDTGRIPLDVVMTCQPYWQALTPTAQPVFGWSTPTPTSTPWWSTPTPTPSATFVSFLPTPEGTPTPTPEGTPEGTPTPTPTPTATPTSNIYTCTDGSGVIGFNCNIPFNNNWNVLSGIAPIVSNLGDYVRITKNSTQQGTAHAVSDFFDIDGSGLLTISTTAYNSPSGSGNRGSHFIRRLRGGGDDWHWLTPILSSGSGSNTTNGTFQVSDDYEYAIYIAVAHSSAIVSASFKYSMSYTMDIPPTPTPTPTPAPSCNYLATYSENDNFAGWQPSNGSMPSTIAVDRLINRLYVTSQIDHEEYSILVDGVIAAGHLVDGTELSDTIAGVFYVYTELTDEFIDYKTVARDDLQPGDLPDTLKWLHQADFWTPQIGTDALLGSYGFDQMHTQGWIEDIKFIIPCDNLIDLHLQEAPTPTPTPTPEPMPDICVNPPMVDNPAHGMPAVDLIDGDCYTILPGWDASYSIGDYALDLSAWIVRLCVTWAVFSPLIVFGVTIPVEMFVAIVSAGMLVTLLYRG